MRRTFWLACGSAFALWVSAAAAQEQPSPGQPPVLPETVVTAPAPQTESTAPAENTDQLPSLFQFPNLLRNAPSASQGTYGQDSLQVRPLFAPANVLDPIPGFTSVQENTGSDAGVYIIRGVNTEHGSDFAVWLDDMPLNMPSHAHAQGLANMNFLIPEMIETVDYRKGSYYADLGDFSSLGAAKISQFKSLDQAISSVSAGQYAWVRLLQANTVQQWGGDLTYAADVSYFDDGFDTPQQNQRYKGLLRHTLGDENEGLSTTLMGYHSDWYSTDAQPIDSILANGLYSNLDPTTGGRDSRFSINSQYWREVDGGGFKANFYTIYEKFNIWINPEQVADEQVLQPDERVVMGLNLARRVDLQLGRRLTSWTAGLQLRNDDIDTLRRDNTQARTLIATETSHKVNIFTASPYLQNDTRWTEWIRTIVGLRSDLYQFDVVDLLDATQSGETSAGPVCPKLSIVLGPWVDTEYYINLGTGFHTNDARNLFNPVDPVTPFARTQSAEVGMRTEAFENWKTNVAVWHQAFDSELVFNAEEGELEALGPSRRYGVEWNNRIILTDRFFWDTDWAWAHARFVNGDRIPQSLSDIVKTGPTLQFENGVYAFLQFNYLSPRPLVEDGSAFSQGVHYANLQVGRRWGGWQASLDWFNVLGSKDYALALAEGAELFVRPLDPQQVRFTLRRYY